LRINLQYYQRFSHSQKDWWLCWKKRKSSDC